MGAALHSVAATCAYAFLLLCVIVCSIYVPDFGSWRAGGKQPPSTDEGKRAFSAFHRGRFFPIVVQERAERRNLGFNGQAEFVDLLLLKVKSC